MADLLWACGATFLWGAVHFLSAIPAGMKMGLNVFVAALAAWAGYVAIGAVVLLAGERARDWLKRRFRLEFTPDPTKLFWRAWLRGGMPGLGFLAPVTCGPYIAALIALGLGERPMRILLWIMAGAVPYAIVLGALSAAGFAYVDK